jgi:hypothetical protein
MNAFRTSIFITLAVACPFGAQVFAQAPKKQPPPPRNAPAAPPMQRKQPSQRPQPPQRPQTPPPNARTPQFGDPLPGLTRRELQEFNDGKDDFEGWRRRPAAWGRSSTASHA